MAQSGVGIFLAPNRTGQFIVTRIMSGGPAQRSGQVQMGDVLVAVNGQGLEGFPVEQTRRMIVGPQGSACNLTLRRGGQTFVASLVREPTRSPSPDLGPRREAPNYPPQGGGRGPTPQYPPQRSAAPGGPSGISQAGRLLLPQEYTSQGSAQPYGGQAPASYERSSQGSVAPVPKSGGPWREVSAPPYLNRRPSASPMPGRPGMQPPWSQEYGHQPLHASVRPAGMPPPGSQEYRRHPSAGPEHRRHPSAGPHYAQQQERTQLSPGSGGQRQMLYTPQRQRPGPMYGYTPSPSAGPDRARQMYDMYGRPIAARPSMSPAPTRPTPPDSPLKGGLGMTLRNDVQGDLRVTDIALGGPAGTSNAFKRGDIIAVIGGRNVRGMSVVQAKDLIMGPVGSKVVLGVHRENAPFRGGAQSGPGEFFEVTLIRAGHVPAARDTSIPRYSQSQSPMVQNRPGAPNLLTPSPFANRGRQTGGNDYQGTPGSEPARKPPVQVNEAMCGIGVFIESSANGLLTIKHVTPDGPASHVSEVQSGDFLVAIDGLTTLGMPMHQVRNMIVGRRGTSLCLSLRRLIHDPRSGDTLSPVFDVNIVREPPRALRPAPGAPSMPQNRNAGPPSPNQTATPLRGQSYAPQRTAPPLLQMPRPVATVTQENAPPVDIPADFNGICGVGINVIEFDGAIIIQKVFPGGPAARSGLVMKGDLVQRLDYRTVSDMPIEEVRSLMQGPRLSSVVLGLIKPKYRLRVNVRLQREYVAEELNQPSFIHTQRNSGSVLRSGPAREQSGSIIAEQSGPPIINLVPPSSFGMDQNGLPPLGTPEMWSSWKQSGSITQSFSSVGADMTAASRNSSVQRTSLKELTNVTTGPDVVL